jgi:hypothetical protein
MIFARQVSSHYLSYVVLVQPQEANVIRKDSNAINREPIRRSRAVVRVVQRLVRGPRWPQALLPDHRRTGIGKTGLGNEVVIKVASNDTKVLRPGCREGAGARRGLYPYEAPPCSYLFTLDKGKLII